MLQLTGVILPMGIVGDAYNIQLSDYVSVSGGSGIYNYSVIGGLPPGLISGDNTISGTPVEGGV
jgi:hypothetical protein